MSAVTTKRVVVEVVEPAMDSRALNLDQARLLYSPDTPEIDSYLEYVHTLASRGVSADVISKLERYGWLLTEMNGREGTFARVVAGNGERIARDLRSADGRQSLKRPALRRRLVPILDVIVKGSRADPMAYVRAGRDLAGLEREVPTETLLSSSLAHELGDTKARLLHKLIGGPR